MSNIPQTGYEDGRRVAPLEKRCSHLYEDGRRCRGYRAKSDAQGRCSGHAGLNPNLLQAGAKGAAVQRERKRRRQLLGLHKADPRLLAKLILLDRAEEVARRIVDAPLDDERMGTLERQKALLAAHAFAFDEKADVERPASASEVAAMGWRAVEKLAEVLLAQHTGDVVHDPLPVLEGALVAGQKAGAEQHAEGQVQPRLRDRAALA